ncbi:hypothetical protein RvY_13193 [Ramazzottius varieornatus]|uniref:Molybdopterin synthase sulfur carrier subunit n=1 Tax=Ramazzottius varieornatus TaxID=947166 RepID=A0A1D1VP95_RAMVA|nr:hypothetical protein RvY_13193 [Ramazzottius varieornatus]
MHDDGKRGTAKSERMIEDALTCDVVRAIQQRLAARKLVTNNSTQVETADWNNCQIVVVFLMVLILSVEVPISEVRLVCFAPYDDVMELTVKFLALAKDLTGRDECKLVLDRSDITVEQLLDQIFTAFPRLKEIRRQFILALNLEYLNLDNPSEVIYLGPGDELAVLPPVSGG